MNKLSIKKNSCTQVLTVELNIIEIFIGITKAKKPIKDLVKVFNKDWAQLKRKKLRTHTQPCT
jgi:hypothetical protein